MTEDFVSLRENKAFHREKIEVNAALLTCPTWFRLGVYVWVRLFGIFAIASVNWEYPF
jgi:hypothetical protein